MDVRQIATDITREEVRNSKLTQSVDAVNRIPELLMSIKVDREKILRIIKKDLENGSKNPLNSLLKLFGLRIVHTGRVLNEVENSAKEISVQEVEKKTLNSFLAVNTEKLKKSVQEIIKVLERVEEEHNVERDSYQKKYNELYKTLDMVSREKDQLSIDINAQLQMVAEHEQYVLSLCGKEGMDSTMAKQSLDLLADFGISVSWNDVTDNSRFSVVKCSDLQKHRIKPCLIYQEKVLIKGVYFVEADS